MDAMWAVGFGLGFLPLVIWVLRSFNEWRYCYPYLTFKSGRKLPPGHLGWPIIGEWLDFLWCFKFTKRPDDFIWKRIAKYGDTGVYRTHLFGSPTIITCSPEANKFMTGGGTESGSLTAGWPSPQVIGANSIGMVEGAQHKRIRRYLMEAINSPESLKRMFITLQPSLREALKNWALKGTIAAFHEVNEVQFSNICRLLFSFQSAPMLKEMRRIYTGLVAGLRAQPINLPGTAFHSAVKEENRLIREKKGKDEHLIYEDIKDMTYTSKVIDEVVRVSHVSSFVFRTVAKDIEFNGYIFPKGWKVIIWLRSNHVDPRYFENPLEFKPERWDGPKPKAGAYYAFGSGPRLCPGSNLAKMQLFMFLHLVSNDYKWELENPNSKIKHLPHSMVVDGAKMKFSHI
ncbi:hypothetical protein SUGI_0481080 [Cryptomeria japonica]|nr:hypothetical protein SUGI_0481080 [Cryptomeria japonica]